MGKIIKCALQKVGCHHPGKCCTDCEYVCDAEIPDQCRWWDRWDNEHVCPYKITIENDVISERQGLTTTDNKISIEKQPEPSTKPRLEPKLAPKKGIKTGSWVIELKIDVERYIEEHGIIEFYQKIYLPALTEAMKDE